MDKVDYVLNEARSSKPGHHHCHWPGCTTPVPPAMWGCKRHWFKLPKHLRDAIWKYYRPGQEIDKSPSRQYVETATAIQLWVKQNDAGLTSNA